MNIDKKYEYFTIFMVIMAEFLLSFNYPVERPE